MKKVRWAVVGTSDFALNWLARGIRLGSNSELAAIVSRNTARAKESAETVGASHSFTSIESIDTSLVDGVFLSTPNPQHAPMSIAAAQRGLHVICEKPMAPTLAECQAMIDATRANNVVLAVAHCMEWTSPIQKARELLERDAIGDIISSKISASYNSVPAQDGAWRQDDPTDAGGGPLFDMGVHALDAIIRLLGPVERVAGFVDRRVHHYAGEDNATLLLRFRSGAHGVMESRFNCNQNALEIQGARGRIWSNAWWGREFSGDLHMQAGGEVVDFDLPVVNVYVPQIEHISECVLSGKTPVISGERGMANIAVIWAGIESSRTGRIVDVATT
jgi:predicted dehydrogenase